MILTFVHFYAAVMLLFCIVSLAAWVRSRTQVRKFWKHGIGVGVILVGFEVLTLALTPTVWVPLPALRIWACGLDFLKMVGFTTLGMYYCMAMGWPSFPILLKRFTVAETFDVGSPLRAIPDVTLPAAQMVCTTPESPCDSSPDPVVPTDSPVVNVDTASPATPEVSSGTAIVSALVVSGVCVIYSVLLFWLVSPQVSTGRRIAFATDGVESAQTVTVQVVLFLLLVALGEEIIFRLGMQSFLAKHLRLRQDRYWIAIVITTAIWTMGHAGALEPAWVKLAQIFPLGLLLGWLCRRYGVESSILAHATFNVALALPSTILIDVDRSAGRDAVPFAARPS